MNELFGKVIYSYSRADAIEDGVLVDLSANFPEEARIYKYHIACTASVWSLVEQSVANRKYCNSAAGIVWDIMYMSQRGVIARPDEQTVIFQVIIAGVGRRTHTMKAVCGAGDELEPVITVMLEGED